MIITRTMLKHELVQKLYPNSISIRLAMQQLRREIDICPALMEKIADAGRTKHHYYNKQQLLLILKHFSITLEEFEQL